MDATRRESRRQSQTDRRRIAPLDLSRVHHGCPDLLVGFQSSNYLLEVKRDKKAKLTPDQVEFFASWRGQRVVVTNLDEAIKATSGYEKRGFNEQRPAGS